MADDPRTSEPPIPHHQLQPGDIFRWQSDRYPHNIHRWRVHSVCIGGKMPDGRWTESIIEMESLTHAPGHGVEFDMDLVIVAVPEVLVRALTIEDVGDQFGVPSSRRCAP
jgi:hypothetical protein